MPCSQCGAVGELGESETTGVFVVGSGPLPSFLREIFSGGGKPEARAAKTDLSDAILDAGKQPDAPVAPERLEALKRKILDRPSSSFRAPCGCEICLAGTAGMLANRAAAALIRSKNPEERARLAETLADALALEQRHLEAAKERK